MPFPSGRNHPEEKVHCLSNCAGRFFKKLLRNLKEQKKKNSIEEAKRRQKDSNFDTLGKTHLWVSACYSYVNKRGPLKAWWGGGRNISKGGLARN